MAATWNPADKSAGVTLSGGNLISTYASGSGDVGARSTTSNSLGKVYFEATPSNLLGVDKGIGLSNASQSFVTLAGNATGGIMYYLSGNVWKSGALFYAGGLWNTVNAGGFAIDFATSQVWVRNGSAPTRWNNSTSNDPATGVGGQSLSGLNPALFAAGTFSATSNGTWTVNFGGSAFEMAVPSGFGTWDAPAFGGVTTRVMVLA